MKNLEILIKYVRNVIEGSQMTELVLSCPRFTRNLTSQCTGRILCPPRIPALAVHWSAIGLGDTGWHCPVLCAFHWAKAFRGQAGQLLDNQFVSFLIWGTPYPAFVFLVDLYKQTFAMIVLSYSSTISKHLLIFHMNA